ncbi:MAG: hypothetical protein ABIB79_01305 [archaeon]
MNEVRTNKQKYSNENGRISVPKIGKGLVNAVKAFLSFDIPYTISKIGGQTSFLYFGKDPWKASVFVDAIALPAWWIAAAIPLGLKHGIIETKETKEWKKNKPLFTNKII